MGGGRGRVKEVLLDERRNYGRQDNMYTWRWKRRSGRCKYAEKELGSEHRVVLIDKESYHLFNPSLLWLMVGWRRPEQMKRDLGLLRKKGIDFTQEEVAGIDFNKQVVKTTTQDINYDYLVISLGADIYPERVAGFKEGAYNLYQLSDVIRLRDDLSNFKGDKAVVMVSSVPFKCPALRLMRLPFF